MEADKIFLKLKFILQEYESKLEVLYNKNDNYYLNILSTDKKKEFFGAVQIKKSYVSFHLMPIYYYPELLDAVSEELTTRMQGKSCFNFKEIDEPLFAELKTLTKLAFAKYKSLKKV